MTHNPQEKEQLHCTDVAEFLQLMHQVGDVFEVRSLKCPDKPGGTYVSTAAGWFNNIKRAAIGVEHIESMRPPACYVTLNPVEPALLARAANRVAHQVKWTTADADIVRRRWLFIDIDARRPAGVSSTDGELADAGKLSDTLRAAMSANGWPEPLQGMTGNGRYLLWRIDLPNDEESKLLVQSVLNSMASQFNTLGAEVDCCTFNAARICKVLGTVARKGDELLGIEGIEDRPHRQSWFIKPIGPLDVVSVEQLASLVASAKPEPVKVPKVASGKPLVLFDTVERARRYLATMDPAIEGEKGSIKLLKAAAALVRGFDLSKDDALSLLQSDYNGRCKPEWSDKELKHKVEDADKSGGERGYLLSSRTDGVDLSEFAIPGERVDDPKKPWGEFRPLPNTEPSVPAFNPELLPSAFREFVVDVAERMQAPPDFAAVAMMIVAATALGARIGVRPKAKDDWTEVPNLWGCVIGRPSLLKTPSLREPLKMLYRLQADEEERFNDEVEASGCDPAILAAEIKHLTKEIEKAVKKQDRATAMELAKDLRKVESGGGVAPLRRYVVNDSSIEKLGEILSKNPLGILQYRDELLGFLRKFEQEQYAGDRAAWLELWDGKGCHITDRIGRGTITIKRASASLIGSIQPSPLQAYFENATNGGAGDDGLIQRLQLMVWPIADREWVLVDRYPDTIAKGHAWDAIENLSKLDPADIGAELGEGEALPYLRFDRDSQAIFNQWLTKLEREMRSDTVHPTMESHLAKYRGLMPTLALICHLADGERGPIGEASTRRAVAWCDYLAGHAARVYHAAERSEESAVRRLVARILAGDVQDGFTIKEVYRNNWQGLGREATINAVELLLELGWLRTVQEETGGRKKTIYRIHPLAFQTCPKGAETIGSVGSTKKPPLDTSDTSGTQGVRLEIEPTAAREKGFF